MQIVISSSEAKKPFRHQKFRETQECSRTNIFGAVRQQIFVRRSWYSPRRPKMFRQQKFYETQKCSPTKFFGTVRQQILEWRSWYSPLRHKICRHQIFCEAQKFSPTKFLGTVRQQIFEWRSWYSPLHKFFRYQNFSKTQKASSSKFFDTGTKEFWQENVKRPSKPSPLLPKKFSTPKVLWNTEVFPYEVFRYGETTSFRLKIVIFSSEAKNFRYQKFCETQECSLTNNFGAVRQQTFDKKSRYSLLTSYP